MKNKEIREAIATLQEVLRFREATGLDQGNVNRLK